MLYGLGAAIKTTVNLALELKRQFNDRIDWEITTSTVKLFDDIEPENKVLIQAIKYMNSI